VSSPSLRTQNALPLPGGRILLMVSLPNSNSTGFAELLPNGALNRGFGEEGVVIEGINVFAEEWGDQVAVDQQGRILLAYGDAAGNATVTRLLPNGSPDPSFGTDGTATVQAGHALSTAHSVAIAQNGEIVLGGLAGEFTFVARLREDGMPSPTFGSNGCVLLGRNEYGANDVALGPGGRMFVATGESFAREIWRLQADGSVDRSFGNRGKIVIREQGSIPPGMRPDVATKPKISVLPNGEVVVLGWVVRNTSGPQYSAVTVLRYRSDGQPDSSFGGSGHVILGFGAQAFPAAFAVRRSGGVVIDAELALNGSNGHKSQSYLAVASVLPSGRLDRNFGQGGLARFKFGDGRWVAASGLVLQRGQAVAVGYIGGTTPADGPERTVLARVPLSR
jgi:uncharacterized delta-60 repeat protein